MKVKIIQPDLEVPDRSSLYAKQLLSRMLESHSLLIRSVTVEVNHSLGFPLGEYDYHCSIQICMMNGHRMKTDVRHCDEILAIYQAVDKAQKMMVNQV